MDYLIDTIEARLQMKIGQQAFEIEVLKQQLSEAYRKIEDMEKTGESGHKAP